MDESRVLETQVVHGLDDSRIKIEGVPLTIFVHVGGFGSFVHWLEMDQREETKIQAMLILTK